MGNFRQRIRPHVDAELAAAAAALSRGDAQLAFRRSGRELLGQVLRIAGAATKTAFGLVPEGNTGGANVSPIRPMAIPSDLASMIRTAKQAEDS